MHESYTYDEFIELKNIIAQRACWYKERGYTLAALYADTRHEDWPEKIVSDVWHELSE